MDGQSSSCVASFPPLVWTVLVDLWKEAAPAAWNSSASPLPPGPTLLPQAPHADHSLPSAYRGHPHCRPCTQWACHVIFLFCSMIVLVFSSFLFYLTTSNRCDFYLKKVSGGGEDIFKLLVLLWSTFHYYFTICHSGPTKALKYYCLTLAAQIMHSCLLPLSAAAILVVLLAAARVH